MLKNENVMRANLKKWSVIIPSILLVVGISLGDFSIFNNSELTTKWYIWRILVPVYIAFYIMQIKSFYIEKTFICFIALFSTYLFIRNWDSIGNYSFFINYLLFIGIIFLSYNLFLFEKKNFDYIAITFLFATFLLILNGMGQYFSLWGTDYFEEFGAICGTYSNPAEYAATISISMPFILYFTISKKGTTRIIARILFCMAFIVVFVSASRTGIIVCLSIVCTYLFKYKRQHLQWWNIVTALCFLVLILGYMYYMKEDSANGRLLIWKCTFNMIMEKIIFGYGYNGFESQYMLYQADYFTNHPDSNYTLLADNVRHPFNEFLLLTVEFGLCSLILIIILIVYLIKIYLKQKNEITYTCISTLLSIGIFSCFSYPFNIPFTWLILCFSIGILLSFSTECKTIPINKYIRCIFVTFICILFIFMTRRGYYEYRWYQLKQLDTILYREHIISEYEYLYNYLFDDPYFLYDYTAEMNYLKVDEITEDLIENCEKRINGYSIQMLKADIKKNIGKLGNAQKCYILASHMCPSKFAPLYELAKIYEMQEDYKNAIKIATVIINKPIKIPSVKIDAIKELMREKVHQLEDASCKINETLPKL